MKKFKSKELTIGFCMLLSIVILIFGIDFLKGVNVFKAANYYYVSYTNVAGLAQSAPVTINGYKVGLVRDIQYEFDNPGHVRVELSLDKKLRVPKGTEAILATDMLGTSTIELKIAEGADFHEVGEHLIGVNKVGLMDALGNDVMPSIATIMPRIDSLMASLTALASDPAMKNSVKNLDVVMENLAVTSGNLSKVMASMPAIADNASTTMKNAASISESANTVAADLAVLSTQLRQARIDSTLTNINSLSASLCDISARLNSKDSSLGLLINDPSFYNSLNSSVASLDSLLQDVKRNPKRYISIKLL